METGIIYIYIIPCSCTSRNNLISGSIQPNIVSVSKLAGIDEFLLTKIPIGWNIGLTLSYDRAVRPIIIFWRSVYGVCVVFANCTRKSCDRKERTPKITAILFIPTGTFCSKTSQFPLSPLDCSRYNCRLTVGYRHLANRMKTMRHTDI